MNEIKKRGLLLNKNGELANPGWAKDLLLEYNRENIKAGRFKIKEWDYYCILNNDYGVAFTIADNGYLGFAGITVLDLQEPKEFSNSVITPFPLGSFNMPPSSKTGNIIFQNKRLTLKFIRETKTRKIEFNFKNFYNKKNLTGLLLLNQPPKLESMVIATPFKENKHAFYYNQKINCMTAEGELSIGEKRIKFSSDNSYGVLDWGRGVWTYSNTWYWGSASGKIGGKLFGFNIGYGFGDTSNATENMIFYNGKAHKIEQVTFHIPENDYLKPWKFTSSDSRFEMDFNPIIDRHSNTNLLIIKSNQHQVFGKFSGKVILDNGKEIQVNNFTGFAEKVINRW